MGERARQSDVRVAGFNRWYSVEARVGAMFWIRRFCAVSVLVGVIVALAQWVKGSTFEYATAQGAIWGPISAAVFTAARVHQSRRRRHCAICKDTR